MKRKRGEAIGIILAEKKGEKKSMEVNNNADTKKVRAHFSI